jgi:predicted nucleic acid-binding protein
VTRLQVLLDEPGWREIQRAARAERTTVADWARRALRSAPRAHPSADVDARLAAIRTAATATWSWGYARLSARDAVHVAAMQAHEVKRIMNFDAAFDAVAGVIRISA